MYGLIPNSVKLLDLVCLDFLAYSSGFISRFHEVVVGNSKLMLPPHSVYSSINIGGRVFLPSLNYMLMHVVQGEVQVTQNTKVDLGKGQSPPPKIPKTKNKKLDPTVKEGVMY